MDDTVFSHGYCNFFMRLQTLEKFEFFVSTKQSQEILDEISK